MFVFVKCVAQAVAEVGVRGLVGLIPGGEYACQVADSAWKKYRDKKRDAALRDDVQKLAAASFDEAKQAAVEAAREEAQRQNLSDEDRTNLELYLTQLPVSVRASLKRADDPTGKTVPLGFSINSADDVLKMLPPRLPRFRSGDALPGRPGWVLVEQLGSGGFGEVWLARFGRSEWSTLLGAVKFCHGLNVRDLKHEIAVVTRVMDAGKHSGVVPVLEENLDGDPPWVMYEYVAGGDLADQIRTWAGLSSEERLSRAVVTLQSLAEDVGRWHRLNPAIIHRDLKPSNILCDEETGRFRITDFGIGGVAAKEALRAEVAGQSTRGGRLLSYLRGAHTPLYCSPQQRDGLDPDPRDDVHALGVIGYQMITGQLVQGCGTDFEQDLREAGADEVFIRVLGQCTAERPDRRHADAAALAEALITVVSLSPEEQDALSADYAEWVPWLVSEEGSRPMMAEFAPPRIARWRRAARCGDPRGQLMLGDCFETGAGVPADSAEAMRWYRMAADQGLADAQYSVGLLHSNGLGVPASEVEALKWYRKAADQGHADAQYVIANLYYNGEELEEDFKEAFKWYRKAAEQGHTAAQYAVGAMYEDGQGVEEDCKEAAKWYQLAADKGYCDAQIGLGILYLNGQGVSRSKKKAIKLFQKAAEQGDTTAQEWLDHCNAE